LAANRGPAGSAVWGLSAVNLIPYWQNTSMMNNLPQKASRRSYGPILARESG
jgi:hypothetical protein